MTIRDLTTKVANNGADASGKLTAEEYNVLMKQVKNMSNGAVYMGVATPTTAPQTYDGNVDLVYIASQSGKYANFGNIVVNDGEVCALHWRYSTGWSKEVILISSATPSGDPMHYAYVAAGATWSSSTGYWSLNTLTDITTDEMRKIYNLGFLNLTSGMLGSSTMSNVRTNLGRTGKLNYTQASLNILAFAYGNTIIEVINLATRIANNGDQNSAGIVSFNGINTAFYGCERLRMIYGRMSITKVDAYYTQNAFYGCSALEEVRIDTLSSLSFADSPNLSKASILYLVQNSKPTTAITITLHPTAYAMATADSDIQSALTSKPNITLISA